MTKETAKRFLHQIVSSYNRHLIKTDPVSFVHRYAEPLDQELVAFLSAELAFGNAKSLMASIEKLLKILGHRPHQFLTEATEKQLDKIDHSGHRWIRGHHLIQLLKLLRSVYRKEGSLEKLFLRGYAPGDLDVGPALEKFCEGMLPPLKKGGQGGF